MVTMIICDVFVHELQKMYKQDYNNYVLLHVENLFRKRTKLSKSGISHRKERIFQGTRFVLEELKRWSL